MKKILEIRLYGDPVLREKAEKIKKIDEKIRELAKSMIETMDYYEGAGLAATQVGEKLSLFVVSGKVVGEDKEPLVIINPEILDIWGQVVMEEGCLSIPGIYAEVERPEGVHLKYINLKGEEEELKAEGMLARVIFHEFDHLNGILFWDRLDRETKRILIAQFKKGFIRNKEDKIRV